MEDNGYLMPGTQKSDVCRDIILVMIQSGKLNGITVTLQLGVYEEKGKLFQHDYYFNDVNGSYLLC